MTETVVDPSRAVRSIGSGCIWTWVCWR